MNITRFVSRLSQPLLCSVSPRVAPGLWAPGLWAPSLWAPRRTITTGKDHVKLGKTGGKTASDSNRDLDIYLGTWVHDPYAAYDQGPASSTAQPSVAPISVKSYVSFIRNNGTWKVEQGFVGLGKTISYDFKLSEAFWLTYPDNTLVKVLIYRYDNFLVWGFSPLKTPEETIKVTTEIKDYKLIWKTIFPDGTKSIKSYQKE